MAGQFGFAKDQLDRYRKAVLDDHLGGELARAARRVKAAGSYVFAGQGYKRVPRGFDPDHPRAEWLLYKGLWVYPEDGLALNEVHEARLVERCLNHFRQMAPIQRWLVTVLTP